MCNECKKSSYRYCARVPLEEFENSDGSFTCLSCLKMLYKMQQMKTETMKDCISALKVEISELRSALKDIESAISAKQESINPREPTQGRSANHDKWTTVGVHRGKQCGKNRHQPTKTSFPSTSSQSSVAGPYTWRTDCHNGASTAPQTAAPLSNKEKIMIEGKRKIWGTLRATSAGAVKKNHLQNQSYVRCQVKIPSQE